MHPRTHSVRLIQPAFIQDLCDLCPFPPRPLRCQRDLNNGVLNPLPKRLKSAFSWELIWPHTTPITTFFSLALWPRQFFMGVQFLLHTDLAPPPARWVDTCLMLGLQLIYGEVMDDFCQCFRGGGQLSIFLLPSAGSLVSISTISLFMFHLDRNNIISISQIISLHITLSFYDRDESLQIRAWKIISTFTWKKGDAQINLS